MPVAGVKKVNNTCKNVGRADAIIGTVVSAHSRNSSSDIIVVSLVSEESDVLVLFAP